MASRETWLAERGARRPCPKNRLDQLPTDGPSACKTGGVRQGRSALGAKGRCSASLAECASKVPSVWMAPLVRRGKGMPHSSLLYARPNYLVCHEVLISGLKSQGTDHTHRGKGERKSLGHQPPSGSELAPAGRERDAHNQGNLCTAYGVEAENPWLNVPEVRSTYSISTLVGLGSTRRTDAPG